MAIGDINLQLKIGELQLNEGKDQAYSVKAIVKEDLFSTTGPVCEFDIVDASGAIEKYNISSSYEQDIDISWSDEFGGRCAFKFKQLETSSLTDSASNKTGSLNSKSYKCKGVCEEFLNAQGNFAEKSWNNKKADDICEELLKDNYKTPLQVEKGETSREKIRLIASKDHPFDAMSKASDKFVGSKDKSSCLLVFQRQENGQRKYHIDSLASLMEKGVVSKPKKQSTILDSSAGTEEDKRHAILSWEGDNSTAAPRHYSKGRSQTLNFTTHGVTDVEPEQFQPKVLGKPVYQGKTQHHDAVPVFNAYDKINQKNQRVTYAEAERNKLEYLSHVSQNRFRCVIVGDPSVVLGGKIMAEIPKKSDPTLGGGTESQVAEELLVVGITHIINPIGETPRYLMELDVIKGGFVKGGATA